MRTGSGILSAAAFFLTVSVIFGGCGKKHEEIDLSVIKTGAASANVQSGTSSPDKSTAQTVGPSSLSASSGSVSGAKTSAAPSQTQDSFKTAAETYSKNAIRISYPVISGMQDAARQKKANDLIKKNALSILANYPDSIEPIDEEKDALAVSYRIVSADTNRITIIYEGSYDMYGDLHSTNIFFTNTIDLKSVSNLGFSQFADAYTMAGYVLSDDVRLKDASADVTKTFLSRRKDTTKDQYTQCFKGADFPLKTSLDGKVVSWPSSFSYEQNGRVYFTIPVSHTLGDYVIVEYSPVTK